MVEGGGPKAGGGKDGKAKAAAKVGVSPKISYQKTARVFWCGACGPGSMVS